MTIVDETGHPQEHWHLMFACDCLLQKDIRSALVRFGYTPNQVVAWMALTMRAIQGVPARPPSFEEPKGYEGREREPLEPGVLDKILWALTRDKGIRRLVAKYLEKTRGLAHGQVLGELARWKDEYEARLEAAEKPADTLGAAAAQAAQTQAEKPIVLTDL